MEQKQKITDEQIALFLSGNATEEDREAVYEYMSESDENLEELMIIAEAVSAQRKADADANNTSAKVTPMHRKDIRPLHRFSSVEWRVAASVAVVLVAGGIIFALSNRGGDTSSSDDTMLAMNTTSKEVPSTDDAENADNTIIHQSMTAPQSSNNLAEAKPSSTDNDLFWDKYRTSPSKNTSTSCNAGTRNLMASLQRVRENPNAINPPDTEFDIKPKIQKQWSVEKDMVISWECNMPQKVVLELGLINGTWIIKKEFPASQDSVVIPSRVLRNLTLEADSIKWRMNAYFDNGRKSQEKSEIIRIVK